MSDIYSVASDARSASRDAGAARIGLDCLERRFEQFRDNTKTEVYRLRDVDKMLKEELEEVKNENVELKNKVEKLEKMMENLIKNLDNKKSKNYFDLEL